jgi:hypothetical protein
MEYVHSYGEVQCLSTGLNTLRAVLREGECDVALAEAKSVLKRSHSQSASQVSAASERAMPITCSASNLLRGSHNVSRHSLEINSDRLASA